MDVVIVDEDGVILVRFDRVFVEILLDWGLFECF